MGSVWTLAVDPVPWARAQMAFTLAVHIILVPLSEMKKANLTVRLVRSMSGFFCRPTTIPWSRL